MPAIAHIKICGSLAALNLEYGSGLGVVGDIVAEI